MGTYSTITHERFMLRYDEQLTEIASATEEFLEEVRNRSHESPEHIIEEYLQRYPDIKNNIEDLFPALIGIEKVAAKSNSQTKPDHTKKFPELTDYEILREIGRGGMGVVYEARQISLDRRVALKTLSLDHEANPAFLERFEREARTAASLHHSNIVPVFEVGFENGIHFFSMQYIDGCNLSELCKFMHADRAPADSRSLPHQEKPTFEASTNVADSENTRAFPDSATHTTGNYLAETDEQRLAPFADRLDQKEIARLGSQIADALQYIHSQGIIHRDIKPSNILLDSSGKPWLADWGLVRSEISELTQTGDLFGSLAYMAPERFKGHADATSDIYSLGVTLYELITLRRIFEVDDQVALVATIVNDQPKSPREIDSTLSADFENVVLKAIDKRSESRYQTSAHFAKDLRNLSEGRPVSARRISTYERLVRWYRRQPVIAALSALFVLTLIVGTLVSSLFAIQAQRSRIRAELGERQSDESLDMFFGTFFPQASPDEDAKMPAELRKSMDNAVDSIIANQDYDPVVVGKLFSKLGWIYFNQQDYEQAKTVFQHAHERVKTAHGKFHPVSMKALDHVGMTLMRQDKYEQAEQVLQQAWMLQAEELGPHHESTVHSYAKIGDLYLYMGRFDECIEITKEVLEIRSRPGRPDGDFVRVSMNGLANAYIQTERYEEAIALLEQVVQAREAQNQLNVGYSTNLHNLARAYRLNGNLGEAKRRNERSLEIRRAALHEKSDSVLGARTLAAGLMADDGNPEQALEQLRDIWSDAQDTNLQVRKAMIQLELGRCLKQLKRNDEAAIELNAAYAALRDLRTDYNLYTRMALAELDALNQQ